MFFYRVADIVPIIVNNYMSIEKDSPKPFDVSPTFVLEDYPGTFNIITAHAGFHVNNGGERYVYIPPGRYARIDAGRRLRQDFSEELYDGFTTAVTKRVKVNTLFVQDGEGMPLVPLENMFTFHLYSLNMQRGVLYIRIDHATPYQIEQLLPPALRDEGASWWGYPDTYQGKDPFTFFEDIVHPDIE